MHMPVWVLNKLQWLHLNLNIKKTTHFDLIKKPESTGQYKYFQEINKNYSMHMWMSLKKK